MRYATLLTLAFALWTLGGCAAQPAPAPAPGPLERVAEVHGAAGPFAVAGYRIGEAALAELGITRRQATYELVVIHRTPPSVQWSCVADGLQVATGASAGKLNLRIETVADPAACETLIRYGGTELRYVLTDAFRAHYLNAGARQADAAREVLGLPASEIFAHTRSLAALDPASQATSRPTSRPASD